MLRMIEPAYDLLSVSLLVKVLLKLLGKVNPARLGLLVLELAVLAVEGVETALLGKTVLLLMWLARLLLFAAEWPALLVQESAVFLIPSAVVSVSLAEALSQ